MSPWLTPSSRSPRRDEGRESAPAAVCPPTPPRAPRLPYKIGGEGWNDRFVGSELSPNLPLSVAHHLLPFWPHRYRFPPLTCWYGSWDIFPYSVCTGGGEPSPHSETGSFSRLLAFSPGSRLPVLIPKGSHLVRYSPPPPMPGHPRWPVFPWPEALLPTPPVPSGK